MTSRSMGTGELFTARDRDRLRDRVLRLADEDGRIVAGAVVGSLAFGEGHRWSDLDLTFAVTDGQPQSAVLEDWTKVPAEEFSAVRLFDLPSGSSIYRVFLLPGCLQFDLSLTPASQFGAVGPKFRLLFGTAVEKPQPQVPSAPEMFGYAVHHLVRARFCIERGRLWQAEYWISGARDVMLSLACLRLGLAASYGRGFDDLPAEVLASALDAVAPSLDREGLLRAIGPVLDGLTREAGYLPQETHEMIARLQTLRGSRPSID